MPLKLSTKAEEIAYARYYKDGESSWEDVAKRVGTTVSNGDQYAERYIQAIAEGLFIPAGRILRNAGRSRGSLFNCYHLPIGDSRNEIGECFKNSLIVWGEGGGVGVNFSSLRPKGAAIKGVGGVSSGLVSFMQALDGIAATVESGGQRRAASLGLCEVWHPEVGAFISAKLDENAINYFNISVGINDDFIQAVHQKRPWPLHFNRQTYNTVEAVELWENIIRNMLANGEPGLLNMSNLTRNNSWYFAPIRGTNPCGEAPLSDNEVCDLGSIVLPQFTSGRGVEWSALEDTVRLAVRFLDSIFEINHFTLNDVKLAATKSRRIGIGVMGLADMLFKLQIRYGNDRSIELVERIMKFIRNVSYEESVRLSQEKGSFKMFDSTLYCKSSFVRKLPRALRADIRKYGMRNVTTMAVAPTGTISLIPEVTSSIEPLFYKAYRRNDRVGDRVYVHPLAADPTTKLADWYVDSTDLTPQNHIDIQAAVQKYTDGAVSKTILLPANYTDAELSGLLLESITDLKGLTVYRDGSRGNQIINPMSQDEIEEAVNGHIVSTNEMDEGDVKCATGTCEL
jgi:ribonucleoside-diphosphate reductase alpha chain